MSSRVGIHQAVLALATSFCDQLFDNLAPKLTGIFGKWCGLMRRQDILTPWSDFFFGLVASRL
jgi:hypothetical protein